MNLLSQELGTTKEENQILSADCHKLLSQIKSRDNEVRHDTNKINEAHAYA